MKKTLDDWCFENMKEEDVDWQDADIRRGTREEYAQIKQRVMEDTTLSEAEKMEKLAFWRVELHTSMLDQLQLGEMVRDALSQRAKDRIENK